MRRSHRNPVESFESRVLLSAVPQSIHVNAGGPAYFDSIGRHFEADAGFTGGSTSQVSYDFTESEDDTLFNTSRHGAAFSFSRPIVNGRYVVLVEAADLQSTAAGQRVMDVMAEGQLKIDDLDIFQSVGANALLARSFNVEVLDGSIDLAFGASVGQATVGAIVVIPLDVPAEILPYTVHAKDPIAKVVLSANNLRIIGQALFLYANDTRGNFPQSLHEITPYLDLSRWFLTDPRAGTLEPRGEMSPLETMAWAGTLDDFIYHPPPRGGGPPELMWACENPAKVEGSLNVLFADGHVELVDRYVVAAEFGFDPTAPVNVVPPALPRMSPADPLINASILRLAQLATPLHQWANDHKGVFPAQLGDVYDYGVTPDEVVNPRSNTPAPDPLMPRDDAIAYINAATDFIYLGGKSGAVAYGETVMFENPAAFSDGIAILSGDGQVVFREMRWAMQTLARTHQRSAATTPIAVIGGKVETTQGEAERLYAAGIGWTIGGVQHLPTLYEWDLDYTGVFDVDMTGQSIVLPAIGEPTARTIALRVRTASGAQSAVTTSTFTVGGAGPNSTPIPPTIPIPPQETDQSKRKGPKPKPVKGSFISLAENLFATDELFSADKRSRRR